MQRVNITLLTDFRNPGGDVEEITVSTMPKDMTRFELEAAKRGWPVGVNAPTLMTLFLAWSALKRTGETTMPFEEFTDHVEAQTSTAVEVNPTRLAAGEDS